MDVLTSVLAAMKLSGSVFMDAQFTAPWCIASRIHPDDCAVFFPAPAHVISYHYVRSGSLLCQVGSEPPVEIHAGQIFLIPRNERHLLGSTLALKPEDARTLVMQGDGALASIRWGGGGEKTQLFCGFLGTLTPINAFILSLPKLLVIDAATGSTGEWIVSSLNYAASGGGADSPELLGKLAELLFLESVKQYVLSLPEGQSGWLAGLRDPQLSRALTLIHARWCEPWTTEDLAREAGLSRSAFADRFTSTIGEPPMRYLARHRMNVAANLLREGRENSSNIAYSVGFNSEAAFNRAFKKEFGTPPGSWKRMQVSAAV